jgi:hypothetical protein
MLLSVEGPHVPDVLEARELQDAVACLTKQIITERADRMRLCLILFVSLPFLSFVAVVNYAYALTSPLPPEGSMRCFK